MLDYDFNKLHSKFHKNYLIGIKPIQLPTDELLPETTFPSYKGTPADIMG